MEHHSSYSAPRSSRTAGSPNNRRGRSAKRNTYNTQSWKDNPILKNLVFYVLPFVIINLLLFTLITASPRIALTVGETTDYRTVDISFKVKSILPIREMTVTLESQPLEMEHSDGAYRASLDSNGTLDIYVKSWNGMTARHNEHIAVLDDAPPSIDQENYVLEEGHLEFLVTDSQSGVDYSSIYGTTPDGQNLRPTSTDQGTGRVTFEMEGSELTVFVSDYAGNVSQAAFAIHTNGIDTENRELDFGDEEEGSSRSSAGTQSREASKASETTKAKETPRPRNPPKQRKPPRPRNLPRLQNPLRPRSLHRRGRLPAPRSPPLPPRGSPPPPVHRRLLGNPPVKAHRPRLQRADRVIRLPSFLWADIHSRP